MARRAARWYDWPLAALGFCIGLPLGMFAGLEAVLLVIGPWQFAAFFAVIILAPALIILPFSDGKISGNGPIFIRGAFFAGGIVGFGLAFYNLTQDGIARWI